MVDRDHHEGVRAALSSLSSQSSSKLKVLGLDGDSLGVDGAQVGVLEEGDEVRLRRFLESHDGAGGGEERHGRSEGQQEQEVQETK
jgi:hypothetical protein